MAAGESVWSPAVPALSAGTPAAGAVTIEACAATYPRWRASARCTSPSTARPPPRAGRRRARSRWRAPAASSRWPRGMGARAMGLILEGSQPLLPSGGASLSDATPRRSWHGGGGRLDVGPRADHVHEGACCGRHPHQRHPRRAPASPRRVTPTPSPAAASGDRYACFVAGAWRSPGTPACASTRRPTTGGASTTRAAGPSTRAAARRIWPRRVAAAGTLVYRAPLDPATGIRLTGSTGRGASRAHRMRAWRSRRP